jgi:DNA invertase Pin-like site-specific DNA recombinase
MLIGYVRVSKSDGTQTLALQRDAMFAAGVDPSCIVEDMASGRPEDRPGLIACLKAIQPGNTLVLWKLDRLGRDLRHLANTAKDLRTRGVGLKVLAGLVGKWIRRPPMDVWCSASSQLSASSNANRSPPAMPRVGSR